MVMDLKESIQAVLRVEKICNIKFDPIQYLKEKPLDNMNRLDQIYNKIENKDEFIASLIILSQVRDLPKEEVYLSFEFLLRVKEIYLALTLIDDLKEGNAYRNPRIYHCLCRLYYLLNNITFSPEELEELRKVLSNLLSYFPNYIGMEKNNIRTLIYEIINQIDQCKLKLVDEELGGEIYYEDIKIIQERIGKYKLDQQLSTSLKQIKEANPKNDHERAMHSEFLRIFLDTIVEQLSIKISQKYSNEVIPKVPKGSEFVRYKSYLSSKNILDENEGRLLNAVHNILSSDSASHVISTSREKYRLLVNVSIETILLLLENAEKEIGITL